jgi:hypothetical protein
VALLLALSLAWPVFRLANGIEDQYLAGAAGKGAWENVSRVGTVLAYFAFATVGEEGLLRNGGLVWLVAPAVALLAALVATPGTGGRRRLAGFALALGAHVALYVAVFALTPHDLLWHLHTAGGRILMHVLPWLLLLFVEALRILQGEPAGSASVVRAA